MRISWKEKLAIFLIYAVAYAFLYVFPNVYSGFKPVFLRMTELDTQIPFVPWTFLVYLSDYILILTVIFLIGRKDQFYSFTRVSFLLLFICGIFFIFFPTTYPRPEYPVVENPLIRFFMGLVGSLDTPKNCFPSMHVAVTGGAVFSLRHLPRRLFIFYIFWAVAIFLSTLTTKQHYLVDVLGGVGAVALVAFLEWRVLHPSHAPLPSNPTTY